MAKKKTKKKVPAKMGRPTKYKPAFCQKIDKYIEECLSEPEEGQAKERKLPTRVGFALSINVSLDTIDAWGKKYPDFSGALKKISNNQREQLINRSFNGTGNANIGKMLLSANHGLREKTEIDIGLNKSTVTLLGIIDGSNKGQLPNRQEIEEA